jgi:5-methylthioadenosine/S-adenosylhomocysteine deaminase
MTEITFVAAITEAMRRDMTADDRVVVLGQDIGTIGGVFRASQGLLAEFGNERVLDTPLAQSLIAGVAVGLARADAYISRLKDDALVTPAVAPHAPYTLDGETLQASRALASRHGVPLLIHLAETRDEVATSRERHGATPTAYLEGLGVWDGRSIAAHAVWLEDEDMAILGRRGVGLAHNPESNMKLASGVANLTAWIERGLRAGLGTDGAASNNDLDMFEAMRTAALLHKVSTGDPRALPAREALELATRRGADAIGLGDRIGRLAAGWQADVISVSMSGARQTPMFDPLSHLVYVARGDDVRTTVVAGRVLMKNRQVRTLPQAEVLREARAMAGRVRDAVGAAGPQGKDE